MAAFIVICGRSPGRLHIGSYRWIDPTFPSALSPEHDAARAGARGISWAGVRALELRSWQACYARREPRTDAWRTMPWEGLVSATSHGPCQIRAEDSVDLTRSQTTMHARRLTGEIDTQHAAAD